VTCSDERSTIRNQSKSSMVEIEKSFEIEIEIYRIEIFRTEIEIGLYRIGFLRFCFRFRYNFDNIEKL
jgi:hypothetical protein